MYNFQNFFRGCLLEMNYLKLTSAVFIALVSLTIVSCNTDDQKGADDTEINTRCPTCPIDDQVLQDVFGNPFPIPPSVNEFLGNSCFDPTGSCLVQAQLFTETITLDEYPGCAFEVMFASAPCIDGSIYVSDYQIVGGSCQEFLNDFSTAFDDEDALTVFWNRIDRLIYTEIFFVLYERRTEQAGPIFCDSGFQSIAAFKNNCARTCFGVGDKGEVVFEEIRCGESCCTLTSELCTDLITGETLISEFSVEADNVICQENILRDCTLANSEVSPCLQFCN